MSALLSTLARILTMLVSLVCGVLSARLVITEGGVEYYAFLSLLVALPGLLTFSDLGTGAAIVNSIAASSSPRADESLQRKVRTVLRITASFAAGLAIINLVLYLSGGWIRILGSGAEGVENAGLAAFCCAALMSVTICLGIWQRVLLGLGRNPVIILLQGIVSPLALLTVWVMLSTDLPALRSFLAMGSFGASTLVAVLGITIAIRMTGPLIPEAARTLLSPRRHPGERVMDVGWPMLAQLLTGPLAMAMPRFILAQFGTAVAVAQYGVAGQVFFALQSLVSATGVALWPHFAKQRARGKITVGPYLLSGVFALALAVVTAMIVWLGPFLFSLITNDEVAITPDIILTFGAMITLQAALYPLGMFMMDAPGLRFQVLPSLLMALSTVGLSFVLVGQLGVLAPMISNTISVLVFQLIPYAVYIWRHRDRLYGRTAE